MGLDQSEMVENWHFWDVWAARGTKFWPQEDLRLQTYGWGILGFNKESIFMDINYRLPGHPNHEHRANLASYFSSICASSNKDLCWAIVPSWWTEQLLYWETWWGNNQWCEVVLVMRLAQDCCESKSTFPWCRKIINKHEGYPQKLGRGDYLLKDVCVPDPSQLGREIQTSKQDEIYVFVCEWFSGVTLDAPSSSPIVDPRPGAWFPLWGITKSEKSASCATDMTIYAHIGAYRVAYVSQATVYWMSSWWSIKWP